MYKIIVITFLAILLLGCNYEENKKILSRINSLPLDKRLFEAIKYNKPEVFYTLFPTAEEIYIRNKLCEGGYNFSLSVYTWEEAEKDAEAGIRAMGKKLTEVRNLCEKNGLDWNNALLVKTTCRGGILSRDGDFNPDDPKGDFIVLSISDEKTTVVILARLGRYLHFSNAEEFNSIKGNPRLNIETGFPTKNLTVRTLRIDHGLLLDPLTEDERKLFDGGWYPDPEKYTDRDKKIINILLDRGITKEFIMHWRGGPDRYVGGDRNKWKYLLNQPIILEIDFSSGNTVSNVIVKNEHDIIKATPSVKAKFVEIGINEQGYKEYKNEKTGMLFVLVPDGTFMMGNSEARKDESRFWNEIPSHEVTISSFLISKYETTQEVWEEIMGKNPSFFKKGNSYPVEKVSWKDCQQFCGMTGLRLPTEAEWEYACRAGSKTRFYWGDNADENYMWYEENSNNMTHPVGQKKPNGFGLYDMSGNVMEWCHDLYGEFYYKNSPKNNPQGPKTGSNTRVERGCSWHQDARRCQSAYRIYGHIISLIDDDNDSFIKENYTGFRCAANLE